MIGARTLDEGSDPVDLHLSCAWAEPPSEMAL